jgi:hypothetical protein
MMCRKEYIANIYDKTDFCVLGKVALMVIPLVCKFASLPLSANIRVQLIQLWEEWWLIGRSSGSLGGVVAHW